MQRNRRSLGDQTLLQCSQYVQSQVCKQLSVWLMFTLRGVRYYRVNATAASGKTPKAADRRLALIGSQETWLLGNALFQGNISFLLLFFVMRLLRSQSSTCVARRGHVREGACLIFIQWLWFLFFLKLARFFRSATPDVAAVIVNDQQMNERAAQLLGGSHFICRGCVSFLHLRFASFFICAPPPTNRDLKSVTAHAVSCTLLLPVTQVMSGHVLHFLTITSKTRSVGRNNMNIAHLCCVISTVYFLFHSDCSQSSFCHLSLCHIVSVWVWK